MQLGYHIQNTEEWWDILWNTGFRGPLSKLPTEDIAEFKREHLNEVMATAKDPGIWVDAATMFAKGTRPK